MKKAWIKKCVIVVSGLLLFLIVGAMIWLNNASYSPSQETLVTLTETNELYTIKDEKNYISFLPQEKREHTIVFYNGAFVPASAYTLLATELAEQGYSVYLLKTLFHLPVLSQNQAIDVIEQEQLKNVILMGHSLGGVVAAKNAVQLQDKIKGLVFLASYPDTSVNLLNASYPILSFVAMNDTVLQWENYEKSKVRLPEQTQYITIEGGNHAGFGSYGEQAKDGVATISQEEQREQVVKMIVEVYK